MEWGREGVGPGDGVGGELNGYGSVTFMQGDHDVSMNGTQSFFNALFSGLRS